MKLSLGLVSSCLKYPPSSVVTKGKAATVKHLQLHAATVCHDLECPLAALHHHSNHMDEIVDSRRSGTAKEEQRLDLVKDILQCPCETLTLAASQHRLFRLVFRLQQVGRRWPSSFRRMQGLLDHKLGRTMPQRPVDFLNNAVFDGCNSTQRSSPRPDQVGHLRNSPNDQIASPWPL